MSVLCKFFGHKDYRVLWEFNKGYSKKLACNRCNKQFGINYEVKAFIPWDGELEAMYCNFYDDYNAVGRFKI